MEREIEGERECLWMRRGWEERERERFVYWEGDER